MSDDGTPKPSMLRRVGTVLWRPPVTFCGTIGVLALYVLSYGPLLWLFWNVHLPKPVSTTLCILYSPLVRTAYSSNDVYVALSYYCAFWVNFSSSPSTPFDFVERPPFDLTILGYVLVAWLVWNFVRWVNYRKPVSLPPV